MNLIERVKNIILTPQTEWDVIDQETPNTQNTVIGYVLPLVAIGAAASFIGWAFLTSGYGLEWGVRYAVISLVSGIASVFLTAFVIDALAPTFKAEKNMGKSFQLAAYSFTPGWVAGVLNILPALAIIGLLAGLYGLYVLYLGLPKLKKVPTDQVTGYFVVSLLSMVVISLVIFKIMTKLLIPSITIDSIRF